MKGLLGAKEFFCKKTTQKRQEVSGVMAVSVCQCGGKLFTSSLPVFRSTFCPNCGRMF